MAEAGVKKEAVKEAVKVVAVMNQGQCDYTTSAGKLIRGQSIEVPEAEAASLCAYKGIVLASSVVPSAGAGEKFARENAALLEKISALEDELKESGTKVNDLSARLQEFLGAGSKKDLDALKDKHADAIPAAKE